jgi:hypothetical protein
MLSIYLFFSVYLIFSFKNCSLVVYIFILYIYLSTKRLIHINYLFVYVYVYLFICLFVYLNNCYLYFSLNNISPQPRPTVFLMCACSIVSARRKRFSASPRTMSAPVWRWRSWSSTSLCSNTSCLRYAASVRVLIALMMRQVLSPII